jgi:hypothetical protein
MVTYKSLGLCVALEKERKYHTMERLKKALIALMTSVMETIDALDALEEIKKHTKKTTTPKKSTTSKSTKKSTTSKSTTSKSTKKSTEPKYEFITISNGAQTGKVKSGKTLKNVKAVLNFNGYDDTAAKAMIKELEEKGRLVLPHKLIQKQQDNGNE